MSSGESEPKYRVATRAWEDGKSKLCINVREKEHLYVQWSMDCCSCKSQQSKPKFELPCGREPGMGNHPASSTTSRRCFQCSKRNIPSSALKGALKLSNSPVERSRLSSCYLVCARRAFPVPLLAITPLALPTQLPSRHLHDLWLHWNQCDS